MADKDFRVKRGIHVGTDAYISNSITSVNAISFVTNANVDPTLGLLTWNETYQTLDVGLSDAVSVHLGQDSYYYVTNQSGSTITKGTAVQAVGTLGNSGTILIGPAVANGSVESKMFMGLAAADIPDGESGYIVEFGKLRQANTLAFSAGDILYLDPTTPGKLSNTQPSAPNNKATMALVINRSENQGILFVRPTFDDRVGDLRDVSINSISDGQSLVWVAANSRFENQTIASDEANLYNTYTTLTANTYNTYTTLTANTYNTLLAAQSNDGVTLLSARANDYSTLLTAYSNDGVTLATARGNDHSTLLTAYSNDGATLATARGNDHSTLLTAYSNDGATLATARGNDHSTLLSARANDHTTFTTITANLYNTYVSLNANVGGGNTQVYVGNTLVANTALIFEAGNGVSITTNANAKVITFTTAMSNVTSQTIPISGTTNVFSIVKAVANSHMVLVFYNGIAQDPTRYTANTTALALNNTTPLSAGSNLEIRYFDFFDLPGATGGGGGGGAFQGSTSGYTSGGYTGSGSNVIDKFPFASDGNASDVGDLTQTRYFVAGQSSSTSGYTSGGTGLAPNSDIIDKFPFASDGNATDVGDLTQARRGVTGQSSSTSGYTSGGVVSVVGNTIDKFPFSTDSNASDVGDLTQARSTLAGQSSSTSGYTSGGSPNTNVIDKFPFAADGNATDVGDLTQLRTVTTGQSSTDSGYTSGGVTASYLNTIDKFPFASDGNASDVGDLTVGRYSAAGQSSTASGYTSGGSVPRTNVIDKFPFASNANATDVGDLTQARNGVAGQQV